MATRAQQAAAKMAQQAAQAEDVEYREILTDESYTADSLTDGIAALCDELGIETEDAAKMFVSKIDDGTEFGVWRGPPDEYDLQALARIHGSGKYRVKLYVSSSEGRRVMRGNKVLAWRLSQAEEKARLAPPVVESVQAPGPALTAQDIAQAVAQAVRMALPQPAPPSDPLQNLRAMAEIFQMMQPPAPQGGGLASLKDAIGLVGALQENMSPIERGVNASAADVALELASKFGGPLLAVLQQGKPQQGALPAPQPAPQMQPAQPIQPTAAQPTQEAENMDVATMQLKMGLKFLVSQAENEGEPETYAEVVANNVPEPELQKIIENPQALDYFVSLVPEIANHRPWFEKLFAEVKEMFAPDTEVDENQNPA